MGCKKKLYQCAPRREPTPPIEVYVSRAQRKTADCAPEAIEREVRQRLANRANGNLAGVWLLVPEHLRLGTWDLLCGWTGTSGECVHPRLAMQLVHEAAVCTRGIRAERTLHDRAGFELANGLPFVATDVAVHELLNDRTVSDSIALQVALGKVRRASGHFRGAIVAVDPHRTRSYTKRDSRKRSERRGERPFKQAQTFWALDADTHQPICFTTGTASRTVAEATPELLDIAGEILQPEPGGALVVADSEHLTVDLLDDVRRRTGFELLVPMPNRKCYRQAFAQIPDEKFKRLWAGYAVAKVSYELHEKYTGSYVEFVERSGERADDYVYKGFLSTCDLEAADALVTGYPKRWRIEEFFNANQSLGWNRAGTMNLNVRYAQMTMALVAQCATSQLRQRLGEPYCHWNADGLAQRLFHALEGDVRVAGDTIVVTYYNVPQELRAHYEKLPEKLASENVAPTIPWLYDYYLDFRFK